MGTLLGTAPTRPWGTHSPSVGLCSAPVPQPPPCPCVCPWDTALSSAPPWDVPTVTAAVPSASLRCPPCPPCCPQPLPRLCSLSLPVSLLHPQVVPPPCPHPVPTPSPGRPLLVPRCPHSLPRTCTVPTPPSPLPPGLSHSVPTPSPRPPAAAPTSPCPGPDPHRAGGLRGGQRLRPRPPPHRPHVSTCGGHAGGVQSLSLFPPPRC